MNRREMRDEIAKHLIGYLNASDHDELCSMVGLDPGATSVAVDVRLGEAVREMQAVLRASLAGQHKAARRQEEHRTASGRVLSDARVQALADEAERGYDVSQLRPRGRR